jgi:hypothetical protein
VLGAQVDDIAVLTVQCDAQQLFLAMTGSQKKEELYRLHYQFFIFLFFFCFTPSQHSEWDKGEWDV